jgi:uncharacterized protein YecE (DUF72 family)
MARAYIGMSGWVYPPWRGVFYPREQRQKDELAYASSHVSSIEINGSFYGLPTPKSWSSWREATPDGFVFSVKAPRLITHMRRLRNSDEALANFFASGVLALREKLGCFLWQLPPNLPFDAGLVEDFVARLPRTTVELAQLATRRNQAEMKDREFWDVDVDRPLRHAIEPRNHSFDCVEFREILTRHGVAAVLADSAGKFPVIDMDTDGFRYARLHGEKELYVSGYDDASLDRWAARVRGWLAEGKDAYVYFDNDVKVRAPVDAMGLIRRLEE